MNNKDAEENLKACSDDLKRIKTLIDDLLGHTSPVVPYLTKYAIVKSCGSIEYSFKAIVADSLSDHNERISTYLDHTIRNSSMNPSKENIFNTLKKFDLDWLKQFKLDLNSHEHSDKIKTSLASLNTSRNSFAHGDNPSATFENISEYFYDSVEVIKLLDNIVK